MDRGFVAQRDRDCLSGPSRKLGRRITDEEAALFGVVVATAAALVAPVVQASPAAAAGTNTTVVLTFDDGVATQSAARTVLNAHGMDGTFYVNSTHLGPPNYLGAAELLAMQSEGHEIGGHTLGHPNLTTIPLDQVVSEVCQDRTNLVGLGLQVTSFAYPYGFGFNDNAVRQVVQGCGYNSARRANGLFSAAPECLNTGCGFPYADTNPPADPFGVRTGDNAAAETTLPELQAQVTRVEDHGGGVVPIVFHEICDNACDPYSTSASTFSAFLDWLQARGGERHRGEDDAPGRRRHREAGRLDRSIVDDCVRRFGLHHRLLQRVDARVARVVRRVGLGCRLDSVHARRFRPDEHERVVHAAVLTGRQHDGPVPGVRQLRQSRGSEDAEHQDRRDRADVVHRV